MATPTKPPVRQPSAATTTIITSSTALITLFLRSPSTVRTSSDLSWEKVAATAWRKESGQAARSASTTARTRSMVSMMFSPARFETSSATAGRPSARANPCASLNALRTSAMSRTVTTASPRTTSGMSRMSSTASNNPGTLIENRPRPVSWVPAATTKLLLRTAAMASVAERP